MGTKIASCFAFLFMGKLELDFLDSCDKTPLICLQFPDDIYLIWHELISKINRFHDTIKFTFNYTDFLGVNIKMNKNVLYNQVDHTNTLCVFEASCKWHFPSRISTVF